MVQCLHMIAVLAAAVCVCASAATHWATTPKGTLQQKVRRAAEAERERERERERSDDRNRETEKERARVGFQAEPLQR